MELPSAALQRRSTAADPPPAMPPVTLRPDHLLVDLDAQPPAEVKRDRAGLGVPRRTTAHRLGSASVVRILADGPEDKEGTVPPTHGRSVRSRRPFPPSLHVFTLVLLDQLLDGLLVDAEAATSFGKTSARDISSSARTRRSCSPRRRRTCTPCGGRRCQVFSPSSSRRFRK